MLSNYPFVFWITWLVCVYIVHGRSVSQQISTIIPPRQPTLTYSSDFIKGEDIANEEMDNSKHELRFPAKQEGKVNDHQNASAESSITTDLSASDITTVNSTTTVAEQFHSNFNLALIPVVVGVVFIIAVCLKCCQWFRQYTRGGSKDNKYYAEIVEDGDDAHLDIVSDTTSTANNDTVSSYASFLRKTNNDCTVKSPKSLKAFNDLTDSPRKWLFSKISHGRLGNQKLDSLSSDTESDVPLARLKRECRITSGTSSSSGEETEVTEIEPLNSSDASILRKQNRFRVSFITENDESSPRYLLDSDFAMEDRRQPTLKRLPQSPISMSNLVMSSSKPRKISNIAKPQMVTVGTQTNKTCRKSLRNSQIRHLSDSTVPRIHQEPQAETLVSKELVRTQSFKNTGPLKSTCNYQTIINTNNGHTYSTNEVDNSDIGNNNRLNEPVQGNGDVLYSQTDKKKCSINSMGCNSESTEADFTDDVFMSDTEQNYMTTSGDDVFISNVHENTIQTISQEVGVDSVETAVSHCDNFLLSEAQPNTVCDSHDVMHMTSPSNTKNHMEGLSMYHSNSSEKIENSRDMGDLVSTCTYCGRSTDGRVNSPPPRCHISINSDRRSLSVPSLESSGYAEELSLDGCD